MKVTARLVKAFTRNPAEGNPAGIIYDADVLTDAQLQAMAVELGFSESAFVQRSEVADARVRFFAPKQEVDFCGHATVATFFALMQSGRWDFEKRDTITVRQETKAGVFPVTLHRDGLVMMTQGRVTFGEVVNERAVVARLLGLAVGDLTDQPLQRVATVSPKLVVPVKSLAVLRRTKPNLNGITAYCEQAGFNGFYAFTTEAPDGSADVAARFFNPRMGINEDPATGVAAGPLACYADRYLFDGQRKQLTIAQGFDMGKPGLMYTDITGEVQVGGYACSFGEREITVAD